MEEKADFDRENYIQLFIGGCHPELTKEIFHNYFLKFGKIMESRLVFDKLTGKKKKFFTKKISKKKANFEVLAL